MKSIFLAKVFTLVIGVSCVLFSSATISQSAQSYESAWEVSDGSNAELISANANQQDLGSNSIDENKDWRVNLATIFITIIIAGIVVYAMIIVIQKNNRNDRKRSLNSLNSQSSFTNAQSLRNNTYSEQYTVRDYYLSDQYNREKIEKCKKIVVEVSDLKRDAVNRYEHDIDLLIDEVVRVIKGFKSSTKEQFLIELQAVDLTGFGKQEKIEEFENKKVHPIFKREWSALQGKIAHLGDRFYQTESKLEERFEQILEKLKKKCSSLNVPPPNLKQFKLESKKQVERSFETVQNGKDAAVGCVSAVVLLGFTQNAFAETTTDVVEHGGGHVAGHGSSHVIGHGASHAVGHGASHAIVHGTGHAMGHGVSHTVTYGAGHIAAHGTGQVAAHGMGHLVGAAIPFLNVALLGFSMYRLGKFLFDDGFVAQRKEIG